jgi:hypothetical protein
MSRGKILAVLAIAVLLVAGIAACGKKHKGQRECVISAPVIQLQSYAAAGSSSSGGGARGGSSSSGSSSGGSKGSSSGSSSSGGSKGSSGSSSRSGTSSSGSSKGNSAPKGTSVPRTTVPRGSISGLNRSGNGKIQRNGRTVVVHDNVYYVPVGQAC